MLQWIVSAAILGIVLPVFGYFRSEYEKESLKTVEYRLHSSKIKNEKTFVFLSDLHEHDFGDDNRVLLERIDAVRPDAVLIGGDLIVCKKQAFTSVSERLCAKLAKKYPVFYANGNHEQRMRGDFQARFDVTRETGSKMKRSMGEEDYRLRFRRLRKQYDAYIRRIREMGVQYLSDSGVEFGEVCIHGLDIEHPYYYKKFVNPKMKEEYISSRLGKIRKSSADLCGRVRNGSDSEGSDARNADKFHILMAHSPLFSRSYAKWGADLALSGHFHGGTIRLPFQIGLMTPQFQFFSGKVVGLKRYGAMDHIVSAGLGTHSINIRINNKPELIVIRIIPEQK